jgi:hypothetical protein
MLVRQLRKIRTHPHSIVLHLVVHPGMARSGPSRIIKPTSKGHSRRESTGKKSKAMGSRSSKGKKRAAATTEESENGSEQGDDNIVTNRVNRRKKAKTRNLNLDGAEETPGASRPKGKGKRAAVQEVEDNDDVYELEPEVVEDSSKNDSDEPEEQVSSSTC